MDEKKAELKDRLQEALILREKKAADLVRDLKIPKSAVSQYLSGKSQNMDSERMYAICRYLNVSEPWMLGFDVPMERKTEKNNDTIADIVVRLRTDSDFLSLVETLISLDKEKISGVKQMLAAFIK
jgi:transcriptional regulator with XRE-family HTH domain